MSSQFCDNIEEYFQILQKLGAGSFAQVYKARQKTGEQNIRAIKKIMLNPFEEDDVMNEIENLRKLSHEQIIEYYDCLKEDQGNKIILYVIMNFSKGSLRDLIKNKKKFSAQDLLQLIIQITSAMLHLNYYKVMHLDLKPENILFQNQKYFKLCDFGCSQLMQTENSKEFKVIHNCAFGTPRYISPEIKLNQPRVNNSSCDIWSLGIILYEIIYDKHPFTTNPKNGEVDRVQLQNFKALQKIIQYPQTPEGYPVEILKEMLTSDVQARLSWRRLKEKLIKDYGRLQIEFQEIQTAYEKLRKTLLIFISIIYLIRDNIEQNPNNFWSSHEKSLKELSDLLVNICYLHSIQFQHFFCFKKVKLPQEKVKQLYYYNKNFEVQQKKLAQINQSSLSKLSQLKQKEERVSVLTQKIHETLEYESQMWGSMMKLSTFCEEAKQISNYFCTFHKMPKTLETFQIQ